MQHWICSKSCRNTAPSVLMLILFIAVDDIGKAYKLEKFEKTWNCLKGWNSPWEEKKLFWFPLEETGVWSLEPKITLWWEKWIAVQLQCWNVEPNTKNSLCDHNKRLEFSIHKLLQHQCSIYIYSMYAMCSHSLAKLPQNIWKLASKTICTYPHHITIIFEAQINFSLTPECVFELFLLCVLFPLIC